QIDVDGDAQLRGVGVDELQVVDPDALLLERDADRRAVSERIVEQRHVDGVDGPVDAQVLGVRELAREAERAARRRRRVRRQLRREDLQKRIERRVVEAELQL